jgi:hypothetical protein
MNRRKLLVVVFIALAAFLLYRILTSPKGYNTTEQIEANLEPVQELTRNRSKFKLDVSGYKWTLTPRANFRIAARVLSTERYRMEWQSTLSPIDLALGWGKLSSSDADRWISWSQSGRWYFYEWKTGSPYQEEFIKEHSANIHIIPATQNVKSAVFRLHTGELVLLKGLLVNVDGSKGNDNYWWHTSLSRNDSGDGSCELLYLENLVLEGKEYR